MKLYIDVRERVEFEQNHLKGALNIPLTNLIEGTAKLDLLPRQAELIVYCRSGNRSEIAIKIFKAQGFSKITNGMSKENIETTLLP